MKNFKVFLSLTALAFLLGSAVSFAFGLPVAPCVGGAAVSGLLLEAVGAGATNVLAITMASLAGPTGTGDNIGGTQGTVYFAAVNTFDAGGITEPAAYSAMTTYASGATNSTDFTFASGGRWWELYTTENTGKVDYKEQGETDGKSYKPEVELFYPGTQAEFMGFLRYAKNQKWIFLIPMADGTVHQIGTEAFPASFAAEWTSATNAGGVRGGKIKITAAVCSGPIIYTGAIQLTPEP